MLTNDAGPIEVDNFDNTSILHGNCLYKSLN